MKFDTLVGKTLKSVENRKDEELIFTTTDGEVYRQFHDQMCCETVSIVDICGDLDDLLGSPILAAEESTNSGDCAKMEFFTWTFYHLRTFKGSVTIRWFGESNGYYSEEVYFEQVLDG